MVALFDIVPPAFVHFFKQIIRGLQKAGHKTLIIASDKPGISRVLIFILGHFKPNYEELKTLEIASDPK